MTCYLQYHHLSTLTGIKCLSAKYYEDFSQFSSAISGCLDETSLKYKKELDSLLTLQFQTFDKTQIMNV